MKIQFNCLSQCIWASCALLACSLPCLAQQTNVPNASFEEGKIQPDSWKLSGGTGEWSNESHSGLRSISVSGTGEDEDSNYWYCQDVEFESGQTYRISFFTKVSHGSTGGTIMTGSSLANRDYGAGTEWTKKSFIFTTPEDTKDAYLRFGQWQKSGTVWFDDIELSKVEPVHRRTDNLALGDGEQIQNGKYKVKLNFQDEASNSARVLHSHTAGFNSNRWLVGDGAEIIYRHKVGEYSQKSASVKVQVGYHLDGECVVDASKDGKNWTEVGRFSGVNTEEFELPADGFPVKEMWIRLRGNGEKCNFQIHSYGYEAKLDGVSDGTILGKTDYVEILTQSEELPVEILSLGDLHPGGDNKIRLRLNHTEPMELQIKTDVSGTDLNGTQFSHSESQSKRYSPGEVVVLDNKLKQAGDFVMDIIVTHKDKELYRTRTLFSVSHLYESSFGYFLSTDPTAELWWCEGTYKVSRERPAPNPTTEVEPLCISAAKNEYEPFQLVIRPKKDMHNVTVKVSDFVSESEEKISAENISLSLVEYVSVKIPTDRVGSVGDWPDPLPPLDGTIDLSANNNQPIWITVYVPRNAVSGEYKGEARLSSDSWRQSVPIHLRVWNFALPEKTHVRSAFGLSKGIIKRYHHLETDEELERVMDKYYQNFSEHRISPYYPLAPIDVNFGDAESSLENIEVKVDFTEFDKTARKAFGKYLFNTFRLPLHGLGGGTFHSRRLGSIAGYKQGTPEHEELFTRYVRKLQEHLEENGWLDEAFVYWFDEPTPRDYDFVKDGMALIHRAGPKLSRMLTEEPAEPLYGYVDIWCPVTPNYNFEIAEERRKAGEHFWWYVCTGPKEPYCTLFIDHYAGEMRMWLWQTWKYKVEGILVWRSNYWTSPLVFPSPQKQNPYDDPMSYQAGYGRPVGYIGYWGNGDGRFIYPPKATMESDDKCFDSPVNSIRWEMLREGIEDYEYFWLLRDLVEQLKSRGDNSEELSQAERLLQIPESITKSMTEFTVDPKPLYEHRERLAKAIERILAKL